MSAPMCCGMPATWNVISQRLAFFYCKECKQEVLDSPPPPETDENVWQEYVVSGIYTFSGGLTDGTVTRVKLAKDTD